MLKKATIYSILHGFTHDGESCDYGCHLENIEEILIIAEAIDANKQVCIIKDWQWWDLDVIENDTAENISFELLPCVIVANYVIDDQAGRYNKGDWVRSSYLKKLHQNCLFETSNTFYLLVGEGTRKALNSNKAKTDFSQF
jgi:hypothetical protein